MIALSPLRRSPARAAVVTVIGVALMIGVFLGATSSLAQAQTSAPRTLASQPVSAPAEQMVVAARTIKAGERISAADVAMQPKPDTLRVAGETVGDPADVVGLETRVAIYAGRPLRRGDLGPPTVVERNQIVTILFKHGTLSIRSEARALEAGGIGERIRVMNLDSRKIVTGAVAGADLVVMK